MTPKRILVFAVGPVGASGFGFISLLVIAWYFPQEDIGRFSLLQAVLGLAAIVASLGLDQSYVRCFHDVEDKATLLIPTFLPGLLAVLALSAAIWLRREDVSAWLFGTEPGILIWVLVIGLLLAFLRRLLSLILRMKERGIAFSISQVLPHLVFAGALLLIIFAGLEKTFLGLALAYLGSILCATLSCIWLVRSDLLSGLRAKGGARQLKQMLRFGLPLAAGSLAFWILTAMDKVFLRELADFNALGLYQIAVSVAAPAAVIQQIFSIVWAPIVYKWASADHAVENVPAVSRYVLALVVLGFTLVGSISWVLTYFLPSEYSGIQWLIVSCVGFPLFYTLSESTVVGIGISKRSEFGFLAAALALAVNFLANLWLVPNFQAAGAAVSTCIAFFVFFVLRTEFSIFLWRPMPRLLMYTTTSICVAAATATTLYGEVFGGWVFGLWSTLLIGAVFLFRAELLTALSFCRQRVTATN